MKTGIGKILQFLAILLVTAGSFSIACHAQAGKNNPVLQKFIADGGKVEFLGNSYGMDGWVVINPKGGVQYAYTTPEGALLIGMLFAPDGTMETMKQVKAYKQRAEGSQASIDGAEKSSSKSEKIYAEVEKTSWVGIGDANAPYLYIFINTGCDHCQEFWKDIEAAVKAGKVQARLVPYGSVEANRDGAAALLSVGNPAEAWRAYIAGDKSALGKDKIRDGAYAKADANTEMVKIRQLPGPPFTIYRRPADGVVTAVVGRPENTLLLLAEFLK